MSNPSRESYNASKKYRKVVYIDERYVKDFSLNEMESLQDEARQGLGDATWNAGAVTEGFDLALPGSGQIVLGNGNIWAYGQVEEVPGGTLAYDPAKVTGTDIVYVQWLMDQVTSAQDALLVDPATGEVIDERFRTRATLTIDSPDAFDETFERFERTGVPLNWNVATGACGIGYPSKFQKSALELIHTTGTETRLERAITLTPSTTFYVYLWVRTQQGYANLSPANGAYIDFERSSPAWFPSNNIFSSTTGYVRQAYTVVSDANTEAVQIRLVIPSAAPSTHILIDSILVTETPLAALDVDRHYLPLFAWDRGTDTVSRIVTRASKIPMSQLTPPLAGEDIAGIERNQGLISLLASQTWQEHGHYKVPPGLKVRRDTTRDTSTDLGLVLGPGNAFVFGFPCKLSGETELLIPKALDFAAVSGENSAFAFGINLYALNKSVGVDVFPVKQVSQLQITYRQAVTVTKGTDGAIDDTGVSAVSVVRSASQGTAGQLTGSTTSFVFTEAANTFTASVSPFAGGAVESPQSMDFATGTYTLAQVLEALNSGSGPAYKSGKIVGNVTFVNDGSNHVRMKTLTQSNTSTVAVGTGDANTILGFTNSSTNTGTGTHYAETTSWARSGNSVDWVASAPQPTNGSSYTVVLENTETLILNTDYKLGGAFGAAVSYQYKVTATVAGTETLPSAAFTIVTPIGGINLLSWTNVGSAQSYSYYRSDDGGTTFNLLKRGSGLLQTFSDDGTLTPNSSIHPPGSGSAGPATLLVYVGNVGVVNLNPTGKMPVDGSNLAANYEYYQPYIASVGLTKDALPFIIEGESADAPVPPHIAEADMEIAQIFVLANSTTISIQNLTKYDRAPMTQIQAVIDRVNSLIVTDLRQGVLNDLQNRGDGSTHKGRIAEGFSNETGTDFTYDNGAGVASSIGIEPALAFAGMPTTAYAQPTLARNSGTTTATIQAESAILPSTETVIISQLQMSELTTINPYLGVRVPPRTIELYPNTIGWAIKMAAGVTPQQRNARTYSLFAALWKKTVGRFLPPWNADVEAVQATAKHSIVKGLSTDYPFESEFTTVRVEGYRWAGETDLRGLFFGVPIDLTAVSPTTQGTPFGGKTTVNPDSSGRFVATFDIPSGISAGTHDLVVRSTEGLARASFTSLAELIPPPSPGKGITGNATRPEVELYDPIAQSLAIVISPQTISAIDLYFYKPTAAPSTAPVYVQFRTVENGFPTRIPIATKVLAGSEITWNVPGVTSGGSATPTKVNLPRWLYVPPNTLISVAVLTTSVDYSLATATQFQKNFNGQRINNNPYANGTLFFSSNGATWESKQETDLMMRVYARSFTSPAILEYTSVSAANFSRIWLGVDQETPDGTSIKWEAVINGTRTVQIGPYTKIAPGVSPATLVLRAHLSSGYLGASPSIALPSVGVVGMTRAILGTWISKAVHFSQGITAALATITAYGPSGSTIALYVSKDDGATWTSLATATADVDLNGIWKAYEYNTPVTITGSDTPRLVRIRIDLTTPTHWGYGPNVALVGVALT